jgi:hypothetical protein
MAASGSDSGIYLGSLDGKVPLRRLLLDGSVAAYFNGYLLFVRDQTLMVQPVDPKTFEFKGDLFPVAERVSSGFNPTDQLYSISANGILVFQTGASLPGRQHVWKDRTGKDLGPAGGVMQSNNFALSPDGNRFVTQRFVGRGGETRSDLLDHRPRTLNR